MDQRTLETVDKILAADREGKADETLMVAYADHEAWRGTYGLRYSEGLERVLMRLQFKTISAENFKQRYPGAGEVSYSDPPGVTLLPYGEGGVVVINTFFLSRRGDVSCFDLVRDGHFTEKGARFIEKKRDALIRWHKYCRHVLYTRQRRLFDELQKRAVEGLNVEPKSDCLTSVELETPWHTITVWGWGKSDFHVSVWDMPRTFEDLLRGSHIWEEHFDTPSADVSEAAARLLELHDDILGLEVLDVALEYLGDALDEAEEEADE